MIPYRRGSVVPAVVDTHPPYGVMVRLPNGERALLERRYLEPDPQDPHGRPAKGTRADAVVRATGPGGCRWLLRPW
ncbi:hypothetical protein [Embleya sp. NPDC059237]|uniref:hypothetical protein n=1 Tax=Embleya sp. NPDC059237 TaxID=3346784 RepID=UPI0036BA7BC2